MKKTTLAGIIIALSTFMGASAFSQENRDMDYYLQKTYQNNNSLKIRELSLELNQNSNRRDWKNHYLPSLTSWLSMASGTEEIWNYVLSGDSLVPRYGANISLSYPLVDLTRTPKRKKTKNNVARSENSKKLFSELLERMVAVDYIEGVRLQELIKLKEETKELLDLDYELLKNVDSSFSEMTKPLFEILKSDADLRLDEKERDLRKSIRRLNVLADISYQDIDVILSDNLVLPLVSILNEKEHTERVITKATQRQAKDYYLLMENKELDKKIANRSWIPKIALSGGKFMSFENEYNQFDMRLVFSMNLTSLYTLNNSIVDANLRKQIFAEELDAKEKQIANTVIDDYENLKYSYERSLRLMDAVEHKDAAYKNSLVELSENPTSENLDRYFKRISDYMNAKEQLVSEISLTMKKDYMYRVNTAEYHISYQKMGLIKNVD